MIDGLVKMANVSADGKAMSFTGIGTGGWFGEGSLLKDEPRRYDIVALRDCDDRLHAAGDVHGAARRERARSTGSC